MNLQDFLLIKSQGVLNTVRMFSNYMENSTQVKLPIDFVKTENIRYISVYLQDSTKWCGDEGISFKYKFR